MNELSIQKGIRDRWSTRAFDAERPVEQDKLRAIFEAFRWAPSSTNVQPWSIIAGINFDECHKKIFSTLREGNQIWAQNAPVLLITVAHMIRNDRPNRFAFHDVGLASENLNLQAWELDLYCHFMGGFYPEKAKEAFEIEREPDTVREAYGMTTIGQCCLMGRRLVEAGVSWVTVVACWSKKSTVPSG